MKKFMYIAFFCVVMATANTCGAMEIDKEETTEAQKLPLLVCAQDDNKPIYINQLPREIVGHVACMVGEITGTTSFMNYTDLPVIVHDIKSLSMACKAYNNYFNSAPGTNQLVTAIAQRFKISPAHAAANLNTPGARAFLQTLPEFAVFNMVQTLIDEGQFLGVKGNCYSTNQGLLLKQNQNVQKLYIICHPWGYLQYPTEYIDPQRFKLEPFDQLDEDKQQLQIIRSIADKNNASMITALPSPHQYYDRTIPSKDDMVLASWNTCKAIAHRISPVKHSASRKKTIVPVPMAQKEFDNLADHPLFLDNLRNTLLNKSNRTIHHLPDWMMIALNRLIAQPTQDTDEHRQLSLATRDHTFLFSQLHAMANKIDVMFLAIRYAPGKIGKSTTLESQIHEHAHVTMPARKTHGETFRQDLIKQNYQNAVTTLRSGWKKTRLEDNKQVGIYKPEDKWDLLTKTSADSQLENSVLTLVLEQLNCTPRSAVCGNTWFDDKGILNDAPTIYLWVKKTAFESFQERCDLEINKAQ